MLLWTLGCMYLLELAFLFFLDIYPGVEPLCQIAVLLLVFWRISILFSTVAAPLYKHSRNVQGFPILHILVKICYLWGFFFFLDDDSHSDRCKLHIIMVLICIFLMLSAWASFHKPVGHLHFLFGKMSIQFFCSFLK